MGSQGIGVSRLGSDLWDLNEWVYLWFPLGQNPFPVRRSYLDNRWDLCPSVFFM